MQTFVPYADHAKTAACLDWKRLGNQVYRECLTLYRGGWPNHPASRMWRGHSHALAVYALTLAETMRDLRRPDGRPRWQPAVTDRWTTFWADACRTTPDTGPPPWLGDAALHDSHRATLLRKDPDHYSRFGWTVDPDTPLIWPG